MKSNKLKYKIVQGKSKFTNFTIPEDWQLSSIGLIGKYINGMAFKPEQWKKSGIPIIRIQNLTDESSPFNYFDKEFQKIYEVTDNDILISWSATLGVFRWTRGKAVLNQHIFKAIPNQVIDKDFFYFALTQQVQQMKNMIHGTTMKHITKQPFLDTSVPLPPLIEQQKIASILSNVNELIQKTDQIIEQTQKFKKGLMQKLLTKGIRHAEFKKTVLGDIPKEWNLVNLKEIVSSYKNGIYKKSSFHGHGILNIRMFNIQDGKVNIHETPLVEVTEDELLDYGLRPNDILVNRVNSSDLVGKAGIIKDDIGPAVFDSMIIRIRVNNLSIPLFLNYFLNSKIYLRQIAAKIKHAIGQSSLNQDDLNSLLMGLPSISEQRKIVSFLSDLDEKSRLLTAISENVKNLKNGLMQQLLTGRIRVKV